ncbi:hypothetical protein MNBD_NITROSPINAE02-915, partial [hydrothermal vent metagenome]
MKFKSVSLSVLALVAFVLVLPYCGGGGSSDSGDSTDTGSSSNTPGNAGGNDPMFVVFTVSAGVGSVTISENTAMMRTNSLTDGCAYNIYIASKSGVTAANFNSLANGAAYKGVTFPYTITGLAGITYYLIATENCGGVEKIALSETSVMPAEGEMGEQMEQMDPPAQPDTLMLGLEGASGSVACGSTVVDNGPEDLNSTVGKTELKLIWNNLPNETGYRLQADLNSSSMENEDVSLEIAHNVVSSSFECYYATTSPNTARVRGHMSGGTGVLADDIVSNECSYNCLGDAGQIITVNDNGPPAPPADDVAPGITCPGDTELAGLFPSSNLQACVDAKGWKCAGDATGVLACDNKSIGNLKNIDYLTGLSQLYLGTNSIRNVSYLSKLTNLKALYIHSNRIID